jgi:UDP-glucose 4-epimerase
MKAQSLPARPGGRTAAAADLSLREFYRGRDVLVVGADGFLGLNCVIHLQALGARVSVVTRRPSPRATGPLRRVFHGDLRESTVVRSAVAKQSVVFDFAGVSGPVDSNQEPQRSLEEECRAHLDLFRACAESPGLPTVAFCSSRVVYGPPLYLPVDEDHPLRPQSIYAVHKVTAEGYLAVFARTHGLPYCILRLSNPYGPNQLSASKSYGVLNLFAQLAARGEPIRVYGDGRQQRDFIFVDDAIAAFLFAAARAEARGQTYNLGGPQSISLAAAALRIADLAGGTPVRFEPWPNRCQLVETGDYRSDTRKIRGHLPLPAPISLEEGLRRTLVFYRRRPDPADLQSAARAGVPGDHALSSWGEP